jgi:iron uptake system component EfeO
VTPIARKTPWLLAIFLGVLGPACGKSGDDAERARIEAEMKRFLLASVGDFSRAARDLQKSAPVTPGRGWDSRADARSIQAMKEAWQRGRVAYERVEGALAPIFPESDTATDFRYDDFLGVLGPSGDARLFDDQGVIGMHAIERILWSDTMPKEALEFERRLPGYHPAAFPSSEAEARDFRDQLTGRLVEDVQKLGRELSPLELDIAFVFRGLMDLTAEQLEKVDRASTGREESRYALATMADLRANRDGCRQAYELFRPWLLAKGHGPLDQRVLGGFERLKSAYDQVPGASIPRPPEGWSGIEPKSEHAETSFGRLFFLVQRETDEAQPGSLSAPLMGVADALGLPKAVLR